MWSPDGKWIAFATDVYPECGADDACNKKVAETWEKGPLAAHMADGLLYRHWTEWKDGKRSHVFLADAETGKVRDLTPGDFDSPTFQLSGPVQYDFSPDGRELAYSSNHDPDPASSTNNDLFVVSLTDPAAAAKDITAANPAYDGTPRYSPDGRKVAYRMQRIPGYESDLFRLVLYDRASGKSTVLTESFPNWVDDFQWSADSRSIFFTAPDKGENPIYRLDLAEGAIGEVLRDKTIDAFALDEQGRRIVYVRRAVGAPWEIFAADLSDSGAPRITRLSHVNDAVAEDLVITGEKDFRVPYTQSLELFTDLQQMKVPSRLIVLSKAGHWPSWYEMALYYTAHLEWFQEYLGGGAPPWTTRAFLRNQVFDPKTGKALTPEQNPR